MLGPTDLRWVSDIDPGACRILAHRYPDVPNLGDLTTLAWADVEPVDILTASARPTHGAACHAWHAPTESRVCRGHDDAAGGLGHRRARHEPLGLPDLLA